MKHAEKDDQFISRMLEETYHFLPEHDVAKGSGDLLAYFMKHHQKRDAHQETDVTKIVSDLSLDFIEWHFCEQTSCFRFELNKMQIDIPANWDFFQQIFLAYQFGKTAYFVIDEKHALAHFRDLISAQRTIKADLLFWISDQKIFSIFIPLEQRELILTLINKLGPIKMGPIAEVA